MDDGARVRLAAYARARRGLRAREAMEQPAGGVICERLPGRPPFRRRDRPQAPPPVPAIGQAVAAEPTATSLRRGRGPQTNDHYSARLCATTSFPSIHLI